MTKFVYVHDRKNRDRVVTLGYREDLENQVLHVTWAVNRCGPRTFWVNPGNVDDVRYDYAENQHDTFSKSEARILCDKRLASGENVIRVAYNPAVEYPLEALYRSYMISDEPQWAALPRTAQYVLCEYFSSNKYHNWALDHGKLADIERALKNIRGSSARKLSTMSSQLVWLDKSQARLVQKYAYARKLAVAGWFSTLALSFLIVAMAVTGCFTGLTLSLWMLGGSMVVALVVAWLGLGPSLS